MLREIELGEDEDEDEDGDEDEDESGSDQKDEPEDGSAADGKEDGGKKETETETSHVVITWRNLADKRRKKAYDHRKASDFPSDLRIVDTAGLRWSDDGECVFFGLKELEKPGRSKEAETKDGKDDPIESEPRSRRFSAESTPIVPLAGADETPDDKPQERPRGRRRGRPGAGPRAPGRRGEAPEEGAKSLRETLKDPAGVDVWHARDVDIIPRQKKTAESDKRKSYLAVWWIDSNSLVQLGNELTESTRLLEGQRRAVGTDNTPYETERRFGPTLVDAYVIDVKTGARRKFLERVKFIFGSSPDGRYVPYLRGNHFWMYDAETDQHRKLTGSIDTSFINTERNFLTDENAPYGIAGWTKDGRVIVLYDRYDLWMIEADGSGARRLTEGRNDRVQHRRVRLDRDEDEFIDSEKPMVLSLYGELSKKTGYARLTPGEMPERLIWKAKSVGALRKAKEAEVYAFIEQDFDDSPDIFAAGVAGAPLTNMMSMSVAVYWNTGQTNAWIFHESQGRMDRPFWNDVDTFMKNSPIFNIDRLDTPLLVAFGDQDGAVDWHQGIEMYNAARLARKQLVMLVYEGENHSLRKKPNQVDYHYRILEWFGHYLKGEKARAWITEGTSYLDRQKELEALQKKAGGPSARPDGPRRGGPGRRRRPRAGR